MFKWVEKFDEQLEAQLCEFYSQEWWTAGRSNSQIGQMLRGSDLTLGCCNNNGQLIGFARVLTDYTFKAMIFDVIVKKSFRNQMVGNALISNILDHPKLQEVLSFELYCPDHLVEYYARYGFGKSDSKLLRLKRT